MKQDVCKASSLNIKYRDVT